MRKHGITPVDTQLSLNKARQSANNSLEELYKSMSYFYIRDFIEKGGSKADLMNMLLKVGKDVGLLQVKYSQMQSVQEKLNLKHLSLEQRLKHKKNPNMLKTNSEEYLTYHLKQKMRSSGYNFPAE